jgi:phospholipid N-methyltransferase
MPLQSSARALKKPLRLDDEVRFLRSWIEKPLHMGAVMPSGRVLARTMAQYVDIDSEGPLVTKPMLTRLKLIRDAFVALAPGAPFVQFTYSVAPPIPKSLPGVSTEASERIWMNLPPARVWVYRKR